MAGRIADLRIFRDDEGKTNRSLVDVGGAVLVISQFTLYGGHAQGPPALVPRTPRRPTWVRRSTCGCAHAVEARGVRVARGIFGAEMEVELVNDGPMTIWLDTGAG